jgi:hypothetical protein
MGSTHSVAAGSASVVYVDHDPAVVTHAGRLIEETGDPARHAVIHADLREPGALWRRIGRTGLIDLDRPAALLMIAVLHLRQPGPGGTDAGPRAVARYRELLTPGSYLAISHATKDGIPEDLAAALPGVGRLYDTEASPAIWRTREEITGLFGDFELVDPGVTWTSSWHPEEGDAPAAVTDKTFTTPSESIVLAGHARKPAPRR